MRQVTASRARTAATVHGRAVERRQLTVIFCDLIGSTAFFEELDPEEVAELMRSFRLCCASQIEVAGGFVAQFQGDGVIGYFGYTEANESNAERAVRAGLDIVRLVPRLSAPGGKPLQTRVGIATGLAVVGDPHGDGTRLVQSAVGQTLYLAARLHGRITWLASRSPMRRKPKYGGGGRRARDAELARSHLSLRQNARPELRHRLHPPPQILHLTHPLPVSLEPSSTASTPGF